VSEPGLDIHEWESEWASLEEDIADSPETALAYVHELITRMLKERGILDDSLAVLEGVDPEWVKTWEAGAELVRELEDPGVEVERGDVVEQIENYRALFDTLLAERAPP
jgi:predicted deacylase